MKKTLAAILALVLTLSLCSLAWATEVDVAEVDGVGYTSLQVAVNAANGKTVKLLTNVDVTTGGLSVKNTVTLDLNGKTLKVGERASNDIRVNSKASLTVKDSAGNGKIFTEEVYTGTETGMCAIYVDGNFVMESGTIYTVIADDPANKGQFAIGVHPNGKVTINGGRVEAGWYAVASNGQESNTEIVVNGGELISTTDYAIYGAAGSSKITINDGVIYGVAGGVALNKGDLIVNGGTITSKGTGNTGNWGDGTGNMAAAAVNVQAKYGEATATIKGGTLIAEENALFIKTEQKEGDISVEGGTFSQPVDEYLAPSVNYSVSNDTNGNVSYFTNLNDAVAAAGENDTIVNVRETTGQGGHGIILKDGDEVVAKMHTEAASVNLPTLTKSGYTFKGWKDEAGAVYNGTFTIPQGGEITPKDNFILTAVWSANSYYYYPSTSTTDSTTGKASPKTFDAGIGVYAVTAVLSLTGLAYTGKKKF